MCILNDFRHYSRTFEPPVDRTGRYLLLSLVPAVRGSRPVPKTCLLQPWVTTGRRKRRWRRRRFWILECGGGERVQKKDDEDDDDDALRGFLFPVFDYKAIIPQHPLFWYSGCHLSTDENKPCKMSVNISKRHTGHDHLPTADCCLLLLLLLGSEDATTQSSSSRLGERERAASQRWRLPLFFRSRWSARLHPAEIWNERLHIRYVVSVKASTASLPLNKVKHKAGGGLIKYHILI